MIRAHLKVQEIQINNEVEHSQIPLHAPGEDLEAILSEIFLKAIFT